MPSLIRLKQLDNQELNNYVGSMINTATGQLYFQFESGIGGVESINGQSGIINFYGVNGISVTNTGDNFYISYTGESEATNIRSWNTGLQTGYNNYSIPYSGNNLTNVPKSVMTNIEVTGTNLYFSNINNVSITGFNLLLSQIPNETVNLHVQISL